MSEPAPKPVTTFDNGVFALLGDDPETLLATTAALDTAFQAFGAELTRIGVEHKLNFDVSIAVSRLPSDEDPDGEEDSAE